jgi:hypothetical protein
MGDIFFRSTDGDILDFENVHAAIDHAPLIGVSGEIKITDITPTASGNVHSKTYQDPPNDTILQTCISSTLDITVSLECIFPLVSVNGVDATLTPSGALYVGDVDVSLTGTGSVVAASTTPDGKLGAVDTALVTIQLGPEILTLSFTGGYPGSQTELKAGDTFQITGTTDVNSTGVRIQDFGACQLSTPTFASSTNFTVTGVIANRGTTPQALAARLQAKDAGGSFGTARDTDELGGTTDGVDLVTLNNIAPSFVDGGTTFPGGQTAFKGTEAGSQDTTVNNFDSVVYSSPNGNFTPALTTTYEQIKSITCTNPGNYNDSVVNFRIVASRVANDSSNTFNKVIEVADIAALVTVTQPQARLRSGGNVGTSAQNYVITATSNQNLPSAPDIAIPVDGTWQGGGFAGGPKVWTRTIQIHDDDTKGSSAWTFVSPPNNGAGTASNITGTQNVGGFVFRTMTIAAWTNREGSIGTQVVDTAKLECTNLSKGSSGSLNYTYSAGVADVVDEFTITQPTGVFNATGNLFYNKDLANAVSNSLGTQTVEIEEVV